MWWEIWNFGLSYGLGVLLNFYKFCGCLCQKGLKLVRSVILRPFWTRKSPNLKVFRGELLTPNSKPKFLNLLGGKCGETKKSNKWRERVSRGGGHWNLDLGWGRGVDFGDPSISKLVQDLKAQFINNEDWSNSYEHRKCEHFFTAI